MIARRPPLLDGNGVGVHRDVHAAERHAEEECRRHREHHDRGRREERQGEGEQRLGHQRRPLRAALGDRRPDRRHRRQRAEAEHQDEQAERRLRQSEPAGEDRHLRRPRAEHEAVDEEGGGDGGTGVQKGGDHGLLEAAGQGSRRESGAPPARSATAEGPGEFFAGCTFRRTAPGNGTSFARFPRNFNPRRQGEAVLPPKAPVRPVARRTERNPWPSTRAPPIPAPSSRSSSRTCRARPPQMMSRYPITASKATRAAAGWKVGPPSSRAGIPASAGPWPCLRTRGRRRGYRLLREDDDAQETARWVEEAGPRPAGARRHEGTGPLRGPAGRRCRFGRLDILVNNAAHQATCELRRHDAEQWDVPSGPISTGLLHGEGRPEVVAPGGASSIPARSPAWTGNDPDRLCHHQGRHRELHRRACRLVAEKGIGSTPGAGADLDAADSIDHAEREGRLRRKHAAGPCRPACRTGAGLRLARSTSSTSPARS